MLPFISNKWKSCWWEAMNTSSEASPAILKVLAALIFVLVCFVYTLLRQKSRARAPLPPGPIGLPLLGYLPFLGRNLHHSFARLSSIYGPIFKVRLGKKVCVVLSSPALVKEVLRDQDRVFSNRDPSIAALIATCGGHDIAFASYGSEWRQLRKLFVNEMMSKASLDASSHLRRQQVRGTLGKLYDGRDKPIDIGEMALITLVNVAMSMVWGDTVKGAKRRDVDAEFCEVAAELMACLGEPNISDFCPMLARFDIQGVEKRMKKAAAWIQNIFDSVIDVYYERRRNRTIDGHGDEKMTDFLHLVMNKLEDQEDDDNKSLSLANVKGLFMDSVIGGTDTTATTIEWAMAELLLHPEVMKKAQEELRDIVGANNVVEESHLSKLKYLEAILKETLRLHPPVVLLVPHCPSTSTTVGGYSIPKGSQVFINTYAIHRDPQLWEHPLEFRPQRFLDTNNKSADYIGNDLEFIPFGSGRRSCPGLPLAQRTAMLLLGSILHAFDWKLPHAAEDLDFEEKFGIVLKKLKPLMAIPTPRLSSMELYG